MSSAAVALAGDDGPRVRTAQKTKRIGGKLLLFVKDATPPEEVGRNPQIRISGKVVTRGAKIARPCRSGRGPEVTVGPSGLGNPPPGRTFYLYDSSRKGVIKSALIPLEYGGLFEGQVYNGDVDYAGGDLPLQVRVKGRVDYAPVGSVFGTRIKCRPLASAVVTVSIPPAAF